VAESFIHGFPIINQPLPRCSDLPSDAAGLWPPCR
jgi:hypothetical protein